MKKVAIIGGSEIIESDIVSLFLNNHYDVKVSTVDIAKKHLFEHLMELQNADNMYVCELNTGLPSEVKAFIKDCDYIVFTDQTNVHFIN